MVRNGGPNSSSSGNSSGSSSSGSSSSSSRKLVIVQKLLDTERPNVNFDTSTSVFKSVVVAESRFVAQANKFFLAVLALM